MCGSLLETGRQLAAQPLAGLLALFQLEVARSIPSSPGMEPMTLEPRWTPRFGHGQDRSSCYMALHSLVQTHIGLQKCFTAFRGPCILFKGGGNSEHPFIIGSLCNPPWLRIFWIAGLHIPAFLRELPKPQTKRSWCLVGFL